MPAPEQSKRQLQMAPAKVVGRDVEGRIKVRKKPAPDAAVSVYFGLGDLALETLALGAG